MIITRKVYRKLTMEQLKKAKSVSFWFTFFDSEREMEFLPQEGSVFRLEYSTVDGKRQKRLSQTFYPYDSALEQINEAIHYKNPVVLTYDVQKMKGFATVVRKDEISQLENSVRRMF